MPTSGMSPVWKLVALRGLPHASVAYTNDHPQDGVGGQRQHPDQGEQQQQQQQEPCPPEKRRAVSGGPAARCPTPDGHDNGCRPTAASPNSGYDNSQRKPSDTADPVCAAITVNPKTTAPLPAKGAATTVSPLPAASIDAALVTPPRAPLTTVAPAFQQSPASHAADSATSMPVVPRIHTTLNIMPTEPPTSESVPTAPAPITALPPTQKLSSLALSTASPLTNALVISATPGQSMPMPAVSGLRASPVGTRAIHEVLTPYPSNLDSAALPTSGRAWIQHEPIFGSPSVSMEATTGSLASPSTAMHAGRTGDHSSFRQNGSPNPNGSSARCGSPSFVVEEGEGNVEEGCRSRPPRGSKRHTPGIASVNGAAAAATPATVTATPGNNSLFVEASHPSVTLTPEEDQLMTYFEEMEIFEKLNDLLTIMLRKRPEDPEFFLLTQLRAWQASEQALHKPYQPSAEYYPKTLDMIVTTPKNGGKGDRAEVGNAAGLSLGDVGFEEEKEETIPPSAIISDAHGTGTSCCVPQAEYFPWEQPFPFRHQTSPSTPANTNGSNGAVSGGTLTDAKAAINALYFPQDQILDGYLQDVRADLVAEADSAARVQAAQEEKRLAQLQQRRRVRESVLAGRRAAEAEERERLARTAAMPFATVFSSADAHVLMDSVPFRLLQHLVSRGLTGLHVGDEEEDHAQAEEVKSVSGKEKRRNESRDRPPTRRLMATSFTLSMEGPLSVDAIAPYPAEAQELRPRITAHILANERKSGHPAGSGCANGTDARVDRPLLMDGARMAYFTAHRIFSTASGSADLAAGVNNDSHHDGCSNRNEKSLNSSNGAEDEAMALRLEALAHFDVIARLTHVLLATLVHPPAQWASILRRALFFLLGCEGHSLSPRLGVQVGESLRGVLHQELAPLAAPPQLHHQPGTAKAVTHSTTTAEEDAREEAECSEDMIHQQVAALLARSDAVADTLVRLLTGELVTVLEELSLPTSQESLSASPSSATATAAAAGVSLPPADERDAAFSSAFANAMETTGTGSKILTAFINSGNDAPGHTNNNMDSSDDADGTVSIPAILARLAAVPATTFQSALLSNRAAELCTVAPQSLEQLQSALSTMSCGEVADLLVLNGWLRAESLAAFAAVALRCVRPANIDGCALDGSVPLATLTESAVHELTARAVFVTRFVALIQRQQCNAAELLRRDRILQPHSATCPSLLSFARHLLIADGNTGGRSLASVDVGVGGARGVQMAKGTSAATNTSASATIPGMAALQPLGLATISQAIQAHLPQCTPTDAHTVVTTVVSLIEGTVSLVQGLFDLIRSSVFIPQLGTLCHVMCSFMRGREQRSRIVLFARWVCHLQGCFLSLCVSPRWNSLSEALTNHLMALAREAAEVAGTVSSKDARCYSQPQQQPPSYSLVHDSKHKHQHETQHLQQQRSTSTKVPDFVKRRRNQILSLLHMLLHGSPMINGMTLTTRGSFTDAAGLTPITAHPRPTAASDDALALLHLGGWDYLALERTLSEEGAYWYRRLCVKAYTFEQLGLALAEEQRVGTLPLQHAAATIELVRRHVALERYRRDRKLVDGRVQGQSSASSRVARGGTESRSSGGVGPFFSGDVSVWECLFTRTSAAHAGVPVRTKAGGAHAAPPGAADTASPLEDFLIAMSRTVSLFATAALSFSVASCPPYAANAGAQQWAKLGKRKQFLAVRAAVMGKASTLYGEEGAVTVEAFMAVGDKEAARESVSTQASVDVNASSNSRGRGVSVLPVHNSVRPLGDRSYSYGNEREGEEEHCTRREAFVGLLCGRLNKCLMDSAAGKLTIDSLQALLLALLQCDVLPSRHAAFFLTLQKGVDAVASMKRSSDATVGDVAEPSAMPERPYFAALARHILFNLGAVLHYGSGGSSPALATTTHASEGSINRSKVIVSTVDEAAMRNVSIARWEEFLADPGCNDACIVAIIDRIPAVDSRSDDVNELRERLRLSAARFLFRPFTCRATARDHMALGVWLLLHEKVRPLMFLEEVMLTMLQVFMGDSLDGSGAGIGGVLGDMNLDEAVFNAAGSADGENVECTVNSQASTATATADSDTRARACGKMELLYIIRHVDSIHRRIVSSCQPSMRCTEALRNLMAPLLAHKPTQTANDCRTPLASPQRALTYLELDIIRRVRSASTSLQTATGSSLGVFFGTDWFTDLVQEMLCGLAIVLDTCVAASTTEAAGKPANSFVVLFRQLVVRLLTRGCTVMHLHELIDHLYDSLSGQKDGKLACVSETLDGVGRMTALMHIVVSVHMERPVSNEEPTLTAIQRQVVHFLGSRYEYDSGSDEEASAGRSDDGPRKEQCRVGWSQTRRAEPSPQWWSHEFMQYCIAEKGLRLPRRTVVTLRMLHDAHDRLLAHHHHQRQQYSDAVVPSPDPHTITTDAYHALFHFLCILAKSKLGIAVATAHGSIANSTMNSAVSHSFNGGGGFSVTASSITSNDRSAAHSRSCDRARAWSALNKEVNNNPLAKRGSQILTLLCCGTSPVALEVVAAFGDFTACCIARGKRGRLCGGEEQTSGNGPNSTQCAWSRVMADISAAIMELLAGVFRHNSRSTFARHGLPTCTNELDVSEAVKSLVAAETALCPPGVGANLYTGTCHRTTASASSSSAAYFTRLSHILFQFIIAYENPDRGTRRACRIQACQQLTEALEGRATTDLTCATAILLGSLLRADLQHQRDAHIANVMTPEEGLRLVVSATISSDERSVPAPSALSHSPNTQLPAVLPLPMESDYVGGAHIAIGRSHSRLENAVSESDAGSLGATAYGGYARRHPLHATHQQHCHLVTVSELTQIVVSRAHTLMLAYEYYVMEELESVLLRGRRYRAVTEKLKRLVNQGTAVGGGGGAAAAAASTTRHPYDASSPLLAEVVIPVPFKSTVRELYGSFRSVLQSGRSLARQLCVAAEEMRHVHKTRRQRCQQHISVAAAAGAGAGTGGISSSIKNNGEFADGLLVAGRGATAATLRPTSVGEPFLLRHASSWHGGGLLTQRITELLTRLAVRGILPRDIAAMAAGLSTVASATGADSNHSVGCDDGGGATTAAGCTPETLSTPGSPLTDSPVGPALAEAAISPVSLFTAVPPSRISGGSEGGSSRVGVGIVGNGHNTNGNHQLNARPSHEQTATLLWRYYICHIASDMRELAELGDPRASVEAAAQASSVCASCEDLIISDVERQALQEERQNLTDGTHPSCPYSADGKEDAITLAMGAMMAGELSTAPLMAFSSCPRQIRSVLRAVCAATSAAATVTSKGNRGQEAGQLSPTSGASAAGNHVCPVGSRTSQGSFGANSAPGGSSDSPYPYTIFDCVQLAPSVTAVIYLDPLHPQCHALLDSILHTIDTRTAAAVTRPVANYTAKAWPVSTVLAQGIYTTLAAFRAVPLTEVLLRPGSGGVAVSYVDLLQMWQRCYSPPPAAMAADVHSVLDDTADAGTSHSKIDSAAYESSSTPTATSVAPAKLLRQRLEHSRDVLLVDRFLTCLDGVIRNHCESIFFSSGGSHTMGVAHVLASCVVHLRHEEQQLLSHFLSYHWTLVAETLCVVMVTTGLSAHAQLSFLSLLRALRVALACLAHLGGTDSVSSQQGVAPAQLRQMPFGDMMTHVAVHAVRQGNVSGACERAAALEKMRSGVSRQGYWNQSMGSFSTGGDVAVPCFTVGLLAVLARLQDIAVNGMADGMLTDGYQEASAALAAATAMVEAEAALTSISGGSSTGPCTALSAAARSPRYGGGGGHVYSSGTSPPPQHQQRAPSVTRSRLDRSGGRRWASSLSNGQLAFVVLQWASQQPLLRDAASDGGGLSSIYNDLFGSSVAVQGSLVLRSPRWCSGAGTGAGASPQRQRQIRHKPAVTAQAAPLAPDVCPHCHRKLCTLCHCATINEQLSLLLVVALIASTRTRELFGPKQSPAIIAALAALPPNAAHGIYLAAARPGTERPRNLTREAQSLTGTAGAAADSQGPSGNSRAAEPSETTAVTATAGDAFVHLLPPELVEECVRVVTEKLGFANRVRHSSSSNLNGSSSRNSNGNGGSRGDSARDLWDDKVTGDDVNATKISAVVNRHATFDMQLRSLLYSVYSFLSDGIRQPASILATFAVHRPVLLQQAAITLQLDYVGFLQVCHLFLTALLKWGRSWLTPDTARGVARLTWTLCRSLCDALTQLDTAREEKHMLEAHLDGGVCGGRGGSNSNGGPTHSAGPLTLSISDSRRGSFIYRAANSSFYRGGGDWRPSASLLGDSPLVIGNAARRENEMWAHAMARKELVSTERGAAFPIAEMSIVALSWLALAGSWFALRSAAAALFTANYVERMAYARVPSAATSTTYPIIGLGQYLPMPGMLERYLILLTRVVLKVASTEWPTAEHVRAVIVDWLETVMGREHEANAKDGAISFAYAFTNALAARECGANEWLTGGGGVVGDGLYGLPAVRRAWGVVLQYIIRFLGVLHTEREAELAVAHRRANVVQQMHQRLASGNSGAPPPPTATDAPLKRRARRPSSGPGRGAGASTGVSAAAAQHMGADAHYDVHYDEDDEDGMQLDETRSNGSGSTRRGSTGGGPRREDSRSRLHDALSNRLLSVMARRSGPHGSGNPGGADGVENDGGPVEDGAQDLGIITMKEVMAAHTPEKAWTVVDNVVYDVTSLARTHPGGMEAIVEYCAGQNCTDTFFFTHGANMRVLRMLEKLRIGILDTTSTE